MIEEYGVSFFCALTVKPGSKSFLPGALLL